MPRRERAAPGPAPHPALGPRLWQLRREAAGTLHLARDPLRFVRRFPEPADQEVAAVFAALLAFGRVELFGAVLERIFALAEARGGPAAWVDGFGEDDAAALRPLYYRWHRGEDFVTLARLLGRMRREHGSIGAIFPPGPAAGALDAAVATLEAALVAPGRGVRSWMTRPADGSACKRWLMLLRWMVRREAPDLGLWSHLSPADLVMPVDTHVLRIARLVGLTARPTADWRTAEQITAALRAYDPADPVGFDFALAHLGISDGCRGRLDEEVCPRCPLRPVCAAVTAPARTPPPPAPSSAARR